MSEHGPLEDLGEMPSATDEEMYEMVDRARREMEQLANAYEGYHLGEKAGRALMAIDWLRIQDPRLDFGSDADG